MNACDLLFPHPRSIRRREGTVRLPHRCCLRGHDIPPWLQEKLRRSLKRAGVILVPAGAATIDLVCRAGNFAGLKDEAISKDAYRLQLNADGSIAIRAAAQGGLRHGLLTLCQLLEARAAGASLTPLIIRDYPAFKVRGAQIDLARGYFPPLEKLRTFVDRAAALKLNTLWLYLENHFRAPGIEDLSPPAGLTPADAHAISEYAAQRGIDIVPGTNVLSHMEGWFRLERHSDFCDGASRSYPVLTDARAWKLVRQYIDAMARAFPSPNFHAGLDEMLFVGANPRAAAAIQAHGKAAYFAAFATRIIEHLRRRGKTVWLWDDMVIGKNVYRQVGFQDDWPKALRAIPRDAVLVHWWYWGPYDYPATDLWETHPRMIRRVARARRPFVVAACNSSYMYHYGHIERAVENQVYLARAGKRHGAMGFICTQWESHNGSSAEAAWALTALAAEQAWSGGRAMDEDRWRAFSFALTGENNNALTDYLRTIARIEDFLRARNLHIRGDIFQRHPYWFWRRAAPVLPPTERRRLSALLRAARDRYGRIGTGDASLKRALALPLVIWEEAMAILAAFDKAWSRYHRAALLERRPGRRVQFERCIRETLDALAAAGTHIRQIARTCKALEPSGQSPYDSFVLQRHAAAMADVTRLIRDVVADGSGLPYFEKLFNLPDSYGISNLKQFQFKSEFAPQPADLPWPVRRD